MEIHVQNDTNLSLTVAHKTKMSRLVEYKADSCYLTSLNDIDLASLLFISSS